MNFKKNIFNTAVLLFIFIFLVWKYRYSAAVKDDIADFLSGVHFYHGRIIPYLIQYVLMYKIPQLLNIPVQNFAFISEGLVKAVSITALAYLSAVSFIKYRKGCASGVLLLFSAVYIMMFYMPANLLFESNSWFFGYVLPVPVFLIYTFMLCRYYILDKEKSPPPCKNAVLIFLSFLMPQLNEFTGITALVLLLILIKKLKFLKISLAAVIFSFILVLCMPDFWSIVHEKVHGSSFNIFSIKNIIDFAYAFFKVLIFDNILLWSGFAGISLFLIKYNKDEKSINLVQYSIFVFLSMSVFMVLVYFLGDTNNYHTGLINNIRPFWISYSGILYQFNFVIFSYILFLSGYILKNKKVSGKAVYAAVFLFIAANITAVYYTYYPLYELNVSDNFNNKTNMQNKQTLYAMDKMSVFYLSRKQTAVIPRENAYFVFLDNVFPKNLENSNFPKDIYYDSDYLNYIKNEYNIDDISYGMTFENYDEALKMFEKSGGILTEEELKKLDFNKIMLEKPIKK